MELVRSDATCTSMSAGSCARSSGMRLRTPSTVSMMFAPGCCVTSTITAGWPLNRPTVRVFSTLSITSATSRRRTAALLRHAITRSR
jgi:hypothetical protein